MGAIIFETTGEEPTCMYCGIRPSESSCRHLVALIDRTFRECNAGTLYGSVDSFHDEIEKFLARWAQTKKSIPRRIRRFNGTLAELLVSSMKHQDIDGWLFWKLLVELLTKAGGEEPAGGLIIEEGGPGFTSVVSLIYSKRPVAVVASAKRLLRGWLGNDLRRPK